jgi:ferrous iron transport protein B
MTLKELKIGESAVVAAVGGEGALRQHFLDMGLLPGVEVRLLKFAPMGDPMELLVRGYTLSLRLEEAARITVNAPDVSQSPLDPKGNFDNFGYNLTLHEHNSHPGLGESGKYHDPTHEQSLPKGTTLRFALAGQQNCGKTTLFNQLTGSNQHVGNFPGVTVDRKDGQIKGHPETRVTDLPGIYSLSPYTQEETVSRRFILDEKPNCIINIVDATNI